MDISVTDKKITLDTELDDATIDKIAADYIKEQAQIRFERKQYKKEQKQYQKKFKKLIKQDAPFESDTMLDIIELMLTRRLEYYTLGHNVWQIDESRLKIVDELTECLNLFKRARYGFEDGDGALYEMLVNSKSFDDEAAETITKLKDAEIRRIQEQYLTYELAFKYFANHFQEWWD